MTIYRSFLTPVDRHEWTRLLIHLLRTTVAIPHRLLACSPDSSIPQSSHTRLSFQPESPVKTRQLTTSSPLPRTSSINPHKFQSTSTGTNPRSRNAGTLRNIPPEWYGKPYF